MLNIIVFDKKDNYIDEIVKLVNEGLEKYESDCFINKFNNYNNLFKKITSNEKIVKLYIININDSCDIDILNDIRSNDRENIIIILSNSDKYLKEIVKDKIMPLDYINIKYEYKDRLINDILYAYHTFYEIKTLIFKYRRIIYHVLYKDINYIEKEALIKRCIIRTTDNNDDLYIVTPIEKLLRILGNNFLRTHQSCIVNLDNIKCVDIGSNVIYFKNGDKTTLLTDKMKKELLKRVDDKLFYKVENL